MTHKEAKRMYPAIFTAVHYDKRVSVEVDHSDLDLDEVMDIFQTLIIGMGYHDDAFKNWVIERADEYREAESKDFEEKLNAWKFDDEDIEVPHSNEHWNEAVDTKPTFDWESDYFGLFIFVINAAMLMLVDRWSDVLTIDKFTSALIGSLIISLISGLTNKIIKRA